MTLYNYSKDWSDERKMEWFRTSFRERFEKWVIDPAYAMISRPYDGLGMPAFIWITCAIDWISGFWWGETTKHKNRNCYTEFIQSYFPLGRYDAEGLWDSLRNGLVHMYTIKGAKYALKHNERQTHLQEIGGYIVLNLEDFFEDFVLAKDAYFSDVEHDPKLFKKFIERYERDGFLGLIPLEV